MKSQKQGSIHPPVIHSAQRQSPKASIPKNSKHISNFEQNKKPEDQKLKQQNNQIKKIQDNKAKGQSLEDEQTTLVELTNSKTGPNYVGTSGGALQEFSSTYDQSMQQNLQIQQQLYQNNQFAYQPMNMYQSPQQLNMSQLSQNYNFNQNNGNSTLAGIDPNFNMQNNQQFFQPQNQQMFFQNPNLPQNYVFQNAQGQIPQAFQPIPYFQNQMMYQQYQQIQNPQYQQQQQFIQKKQSLIPNLNLDYQSDPDAIKNLLNCNQAKKEEENYLSYSETSGAEDEYKFRNSNQRSSSQQSTNRWISQIAQKNLQNRKFETQLNMISESSRENISMEQTKLNIVEKKNIDLIKNQAQKKEEKGHRSARSTETRQGKGRISQQKGDDTISSIRKQLDAQNSNSFLNSNIDLSSQNQQNKKIISPSDLQSFKNKDNLKMGFSKLNISPQRNQNLRQNVYNQTPTKKINLFSCTEDQMEKKDLASAQNLEKQKYFAQNKNQAKKEPLVTQNKITNQKQKADQKIINLKPEILNQERMNQIGSAKYTETDNSQFKGGKYPSNLGFTTPFGKQGASIIQNSEYSSVINTHQNVVNKQMINPASQEIYMAKTDVGYNYSNQQFYSPNHKNASPLNDVKRNQNTVSHSKNQNTTYIDEMSMPEERSFDFKLSDFGAKTTKSVIQNDQNLFNFNKQKAQEKNQINENLSKQLNSAFQDQSKISPRRQDMNRASVNSQRSPNLEEINRSKQKDEQIQSFQSARNNEQRIDLKNVNQNGNFNEDQNINNQSIKSSQNSVPKSQRSNWVKNQNQNQQRDYSQQHNNNYSKENIEKVQDSIRISQQTSKSQNKNLSVSGQKNQNSQNKLQQKFKDHPSNLQQKATVPKTQINLNNKNSRNMSSDQQQKHPQRKSEKSSGSNFSSLTQSYKCKIKVKPSVEYPIQNELNQEEVPFLEAQNVDYQREDSHYQEIEVQEEEHKEQQIQNAYLVALNNMQSKQKKPAQQLNNKKQISLYNQMKIEKVMNKNNDNFRVPGSFTSNDSQQKYGTEYSLQKKGYLSGMSSAKASQNTARKFK